MSEEYPTHRPRLQMFKLLVAVTLVILISVVVLQNTETVETHLLFFTLKLPRVALLLATLVIGFLAGVLTSSRFLKRSGG